MKLLFIGSNPYHKPESSQKPKSEHEAMFFAASELGKEAAKRNHIVLLGSDSPNTIDSYVSKGFIEFCKENKDKQRTIEIHRPNDLKVPYEVAIDNLKVERHYYHNDLNNTHKWIVAHVRALDICDCVIALGGGFSTRIVGNIAADREIPIVAISLFGGTASELYDRLQYVYKSKVRDNNIVQSLVTPWNPVSAEKVITLSEALSTSIRTSPHLYFLSYSWSDAEKSDHIEALLRRNNRNVLRDENNLQTGSRISGTIEALIKQSDTFLALWSKAYLESSWCPNELEYAINQKLKFGKPSRIILCSLDDTSPPIRITDSLRFQGQDRTKRELSILRLLKEENGVAPAF